MTKLTRRHILASGSAAAAGLGLGLKPSFAQANYPTRPIQMICPWGAGGGTDATARIVASLLEKELGQPVNVVNRTGGSGVVGHSAIATATAGRLHARHHHRRDRDDAWQGLTELTPKDYTPLALMNEDPPGIQVKADSPYKTVKELADAIKAAPRRQVQGIRHRPGRHLASGAGRLAAGDGPSGRIRSPGCRRTAPRRRCRISPPAASTLITCSVPEARAMIDAGKARSLAVMAPERARRVQGRADAEGGDGHRLHDRRLARLRRPEGPAAGRWRPSSPPRSRRSTTPRSTRTS